MKSLPRWNTTTLVAWMSVMWGTIPWAMLVFWSTEWNRMNILSPSACWSWPWWTWGSFSNCGPWRTSPSACIWAQSIGSGRGPRPGLTIIFWTVTAPNLFALLLPAEDRCNVLIRTEKDLCGWMQKGEGSLQRPLVLLHVQIRSHVQSQPFVQKLWTLFVTPSNN